MTDLDPEKLGTSDPTPEAMQAVNRVILEVWEIEDQKPIALLSCKIHLAGSIDKEIGLPALLRDRERLDWLHRRYCERRWNGYALGEDFLKLMTYHEGWHMRHNSLRAAIDAAMVEEKQV